jgi:hypothetical protein
MEGTSVRTNHSFFELGTEKRQSGRQKVPTISTEDMPLNDLRNFH